MDAIVVKYLVGCWRLNPRSFFEAEFDDEDARLCRLRPRRYGEPSIAHF
jgi:hypothetical protein